MIKLTSNHFRRLLRQLEEHVVEVYVDQMLEDLMPAFMQNRNEDLTRLESFYSTQDFENLAKLGHQLKGVGLNYGFVTLGELASDLEQAALRNDLTEIRQLIDRIRFQVQNTKIIFV